MRSVDNVRRELNIELRTLKELTDALDVLERLGYDVSPIPDDYHQWLRIVNRHSEQRGKVADLEAELMRCGNR